MSLETLDSHSGLLRCIGEGMYTRHEPMRSCRTDSESQPAVDRKSTPSVFNSFEMLHVYRLVEICITRKHPPVKESKSSTVYCVCVETASNSVLLDYNSVIT